LLARLKLASEAQRTFVADAAHELRSPLAALKLQLQAAVRDGSVRGDTDTIARIEARLNRLIHLVQQLLALAREDAQPVHAMHPVSLRRLAQQAVGDFSLLAEEKEIDLGVEFAPPANADDALDVLGEGHALTVLLNNLLDNAIRYTPRGGRVDVVLRREGPRIGFEVCDSGPGIAEDELARVCDRFYRALGVAEQGSGLGLAIVSRIVKRHRGSLTLRNREDGGLAVSVHGLTAARGGPDQGIAQ
jgi:two-component system OmpR family sensor kinase